MLLGLLCCATSLEAQTLVIKSSPAGAAIFRVKPIDNTLIPLGTGSAEFKLLDKDPNTVVVRMDGYRDVSQSFVKGAKFKDKNILIVLTRRIVRLSVLPDGAAIYVNGDNVGSKAAELEVEEGKPTAVEVKFAGYAPVRRVYQFERGGELPPATDRIELVDRVISVTTQPSGGELFREGASLGAKTIDLVVPQGACVTLRAQKAGWIPVERNYCNKDGLTLPPLEDRVVFAGRMVNVVAPADAKILVNETQAGTGSAAVSVREGTCVKVRVEQPAFLPVLREYCARENAPAPPLDDAVMLSPDESYTASVPSDQANLNITLEVAASHTEDQAWRLLSSIVLSHFDVLENSDRETGYLRTAWQSKSYADGAVIIRTRVIVKRTGNDPLRYTVKLASERSRVPGASLRDDENFLPWDRVLAAYKDIVAELQARLQ